MLPNSYRPWTYFVALVLLLWLPAPVQAQTQPAATAHPLTLKFTPLALLDPNTSTLMLGVEYKLRPRLGVALDYGLRCSALRVFEWNTNWQDFRYHKFRAEVRQYFPVVADLEMYLGLEPFYIPQRYTISHYADAEFDYYFDPARVRRNVWGTALNAGFVCHLSPRWQFEVIGGLGVRHISVQFTPQNETVSARYGLNEGFVDSYDVPGFASTMPHLTARCKVGYTLN